MAQLSEEDRKRMEFLQRLDAADFTVTDWEAGFIESFLSDIRPFTPAQRAAVDEMMAQYESKL